MKKETNIENSAIYEHTVKLSKTSYHRENVLFIKQTAITVTLLISIQLYIIH